MDWWVGLFICLHRTVFHLIKKSEICPVFLKFWITRMNDWANKHLFPFLKASPNTRRYTRRCPSVASPLTQGERGGLLWCRESGELPSGEGLSPAPGKLPGVPASGGSGQITFQAPGQTRHFGQRILQLGAIAARCFAQIPPAASTVSLCFSLGTILVSPLSF